MEQGAMEQRDMEQRDMEQRNMKQGDMEQGLEIIVSQIKKTYAYGGLFNYISAAVHPDIEVIMQYLRVIEEGDDLYHRDEKAQLNAYKLLCKLKLLIENKRFYFSA